MRSVKEPIVSKSIITIGVENSGKRPANHLPCFAPPGWCDCCPDLKSMSVPTTEMPVVGKEVASRVARTMQQERFIGDKENCEENCVLGLVSSEMDQEMKKSLSLSKNKRNKEPLVDCEVDRFKFMIDDADLQEATKPFQPKNTVANNKWAIKNFSEWVQARQKNTSVETSKSYKEILFTDNASELSQWLYTFVKETRERDGGEYTVFTDGWAPTGDSSAQISC